MDRTNKKSIKDLESQPGDEFREIFNQSPIGILLYDKDGITVNANNSALKMVGIPKLEGILGHSLFDNPRIEERKEELIDKGIIRFQAPLNLEKIRDFGLYINKKGILFLDYTVSVTDSGYLVQIQDITKQKGAEDKYRALFEQSNDAILIADLKTMKYVDCNKKAKELTGYSREELLSKKVGESTHPVIRDKIMGLFCKKLKTGDTETFENEIITKDGIKYIESTVSIIEIEGKKHAQIAFKDITRKKDAEKALINSEEKYRSIVETANEGIMIADTSGIITYVNTKMAEMLGYAVEELIGKEGISLIEPTELEKAQAKVKKRRMGIKEEYEIKFHRKDGGILWTHVNGTPLYDQNGEHIGNLAMYTDITERKKAEEALRDTNDRLELAQKVSNVGTFEWNIQTGVNTWTPELEAMYGLKEGEFPGIQEAWEELVHPEDMPEAVHRVDIALETGEPVEGEWRVIWPDGSVHWLFGRWQVFKDNDGKPLKMIGVNVDITERKKAEEELEKSKEKYHTLFNSIDEGFCIVEVIFDANNKPIDYCFLEMNPAFERQTGLHEAEGKLMRELAPSHEEYWFEIYGKIALTGKPMRFENRAKALNRFYEVYAFKIGGPESRKVAILFNDINERKKAEEHIKNLLEETQQLNEKLEVSNEELRHQGDELLQANQVLRQSQEDMDRAQEVGQIGSWRLDVRRNILTWSDENYRIFGVPNGTPMTYEKFLGIVHLDDRQYVDTQWMAGLAGELYDIEHRIVVGDRVKWVREKAYLEFDDESMVLGGFGITQDITDRKNAEKVQKQLAQQRQLALNAAHMGWWHYDPLTEIATYDEGYKKIFGVSGSRRPNKEILKRLHPDDLPNVWAKVEAALDPEDPKPYLAKYRIFRDKGEVRWIESHGITTFEGEGDARRATSLVGTVEDITERMNAEKALKEAHDNLEQKVEERTCEIEEAYQLVKENEFKLKDAIKELERSNKELQSFAYITSHDLQEPLRTMGSYAGLLKHRYGGQLDSDADEFIDYMVSGAVRLQDMIKGLLEYSRVGTRGGVFKDFNAGEALDTALTNLKSPIEECHVEVLYDSLPVIHADESQIIRVFQNLIGNALKFRKKGVQPKIHIKAQKEGHEYIFSVQDNGIGIEPQYTDRIFEVFKRLHAIGEYEGTGIGLAIVKRIIERHHGRVWVESEYGFFSTFYFTIPMA